MEMFCEIHKKSLFILGITYLNNKKRIKSVKLKLFSLAFNICMELAEVYYIKY